MAFSRYLLVLAMVVLIASSNLHQAHAYTCADVKVALSLTCDGYLGGVLGLTIGLVPSLSPTGQCCGYVKDTYNQCITAQVDLKLCPAVCGLSLQNFCLILKTCGVDVSASTSICYGVV